jgi:2',3'-cyclic-nucleotide 2'-phosphodiesterase (5'-nucleotidase family)
MKTMYTTVAALSLIFNMANAQTTVTFIHYNDLHAHLTPHKDMLRVGDTCANDPTATFKIGERGGLARLKTLIDTIRAQNPNSIYMNIGDTYHGGVEAAYTSGNAIVDPVNAMGIDVGVPGNWDFAYGPGVFRKRYTPTGPFPTLLNSTLPSYAIKTTSFPNLAANLTYQKLGPGDPSVTGAQVLPATTTITKGGIKVGFIGITSDIVPQMYDKLAMGFNFLQGETNYINLINTQAATLRSGGCKFVVVMSELGIHKDHHLAQVITPGSVDVFFSAHTHEESYVPLTSTSGAWVMEAGNDGFLGRLDVTFDALGNVQNKKWKLLSIDTTLAHNPTILSLVNTARAPFLVSNPNMTDPMATSAQSLNQPITTVAGYSNGLLTRKNALESTFNDAFCAIAMAKGGTQSAISPGFRFDSPIATPGYMFEDNTISTGAITLEDVYRFFPVFYTMATGKITGDSLKKIGEDLLTSVFSQTAFKQAGGWVDGIGGVNMTVNLNNADGSKIQQMKYASTSLTIGGADTITIVGCERPNEYTNVLCSHTGFFGKAPLNYSVTGQPYTAIQIFTEYLASNNIPITVNNHITDLSGMSQWYQNPYVQPLYNYNCLMPTGINEYSLSQSFDFDLFPNPSNGILNYNLTNNSIAQTISVYNVIGEEVFTQKVKDNNGTINLQNIKSGLYVVIIKLNNGNYSSRKIIKQ